MKLKSSNSCNWNRSRLENPYPTHKSRQKNGNQILKLSSNMMFRTPEHWSLILERPFLTKITTKRAHLTHANPREVAVETDDTNAKTCSTTGTEQESSP